MSLSRAPIGEILIRHEHLRPRELERLLTEDRKHRLVSLLILRAEIEIDDATLALSEQSGYPAALERHLEQRDGALARTFPQGLMRNFGVVPLTRTAGGALVVVARDPSPALAEALRGELGTPIELAIAPAIFLERLIQRLAGGVPSALPPELPAIDQPPPTRHRKSMSVIMNVPAEPAPIIVEPSMPMVELPTELIQPGQPAVGIKLELDDESPPEPPNRPNRPTRPIPGAELQPLLETPSLDDIISNEETPAAVSTRPTRPSVAVPVVPEDRPSAPHRKTPNIIKRPPTPLPIAPQPVARKITEDPEPPRNPADAQVRPTYPKLEPPPPSVFDAETARPHKPAIKAPPPPPARPPTQPPPLPAKAATPPPAPRPRTTTDNWDDFEDSKVGMGVPPADILDQMSSIGITPPVVVPPAEPVEELVEEVRPPPVAPPIRPPTAPGRITQPIAVIPPARAGTAPISGPQHPRAGSPPVGGPQHPRAGSAPVIPAIPKMPPPIPKPNIKREIETAMSRATADRLLMKHAATRWNALLLVNVVDDRAKGARGHGSRLQAGVESIDLAVASSSLIQAAVDPAAVPPDGKDPLFELLGAPASPSSAPVVVEDRVVAVLAAGDGIDGGNADELVQLAGALAVAYQRFPK